MCYLYFYCKMHLITEAFLKCHNYLHSAALPSLVLLFTHSVSYVRSCSPPLTSLYKILFTSHSISAWVSPCFLLTASLPISWDLDLLPHRFHYLYGIISITCLRSCFPPTIYLPPLLWSCFHPTALSSLVYLALLLQHFYHFCEVLLSSSFCHNSVCKIFLSSPEHLNLLCWVMNSHPSLFLLSQGWREHVLIRASITDK